MNTVGAINTYAITNYAVYIVVYYAYCFLKFLIINKKN